MEDIRHTVGDAVVGTQESQPPDRRSLSSTGASPWSCATCAKNTDVVWGRTLKPLTLALTALATARGRAIVLDILTVRLM